MGVHRTRGEPDELELTPTGVELNGSERVRFAPERPRAVHPRRAPARGKEH